MWLVEAMGVDAFRVAIEQRMGQTLRREVRAGRWEAGAALPGDGSQSQGGWQRHVASWGGGCSRPAVGQLAAPGAAP